MKNLFVYGTLRMGESLYPTWFAPRTSQLAKARGRLYHYAQYTSFPVAKFDEEGTVTGEVFDITDYPQLFSLVRMECSVGYRLTQIPVLLADGTWVRAHAFDYPHRPQGDLLPSGDWKQRVEEDYAE